MPATRLRDRAAARMASAWRSARDASTVVRSPAFVAPLLLVAGMALTVYAVHLLVGPAWAALLGGAWLLLTGVVLLRGLEP